MRCVWKGTIGLGIAAIPVKAYGATEERSVGLHQLHAGDGARIRLKRVCELDGAEVPFDEVAKGYVLSGGEVVVLTEADFATLPLPTLQSIEVCSFAPLAQIDPIYFAKSYYLEPEPSGTKAYVLLTEALRQSGRVGVVKVALRQRETLGVLRVRGQVIVLETMLWPDEIRTPDFPFLQQDVTVRTSELRSAVSLIDRLAEDFVPEQYTDRYRAALEALIEAKVEGREVVAPTAAVQADGVTDLLSALQAGVEAAGSGEASKPVARKAAVRKAAVRKAKAAEKDAAEAKAAAKAAASSSKSRSKAKSRG